jgi:hypothetical protein
MLLSQAHLCRCPLALVLVQATAARSDDVLGVRHTLGRTFVQSSVNLGALRQWLWQPQDLS